MNERSLLNNEKSSSKETKKIRKKDSTRFIAEIPNVNSEGINLLNKFIIDCNNKEFGRKVSWSDILLHLVRNNNTDKVVNEIQTSVLTKEDRVMAKLKKLNSNSDRELTLIDLAAKALKVQ